MKQQLGIVLVRCLTLSLILSGMCKLSNAQNNSVPTRNQIVKVKDFIEDFSQSTWTLRTKDNQIQSINANQLGERVRKSEIKGYFNNRGHFVETNSSIKSSIEIDTLPFLGREISRINGFYEVGLPLMKRVQLEISYDMFIESENDINKLGECYIELYEFFESANQWLLVGEFRQKEELKSKQPRIKAEKNRKMISHSYVANLSKWAGKRVKIALVSNLGNGKRGRWTDACLIGCTFDYKLVLDVNEESGKIIQAKSKSSSRPSRPIIYPATGSFGIDGASDFINLPGIIHLPEGFTTANTGTTLNPRWLSYFHANYGQAWWSMGRWNDSEADNGTFAIDLLNASSSYNNFYKARVSDMQAGLLRESGSNLILSSDSSYRPHIVLGPSRETGWKAGWANGYVGITGSALAQNNDTRIHGYTHCEDWSKNGTSINYPLLVCARIGYVTATTSNPYQFHYAKSLNDLASGVPNSASPIIECFQQEADMVLNTSEVVGVAGPAAFAYGTYVYVFYTRYVQESYVQYSVPEAARSLINYATGNGQICIARAAKAYISETTYGSKNNEWKNYYNGAWNENARGGYSTAIIGRTANPHRVVAGVFDSLYLGVFILIANDGGATGSGINSRAYLHISPDRNITAWDQVGIQLDELPEDLFVVRAIGRTGKEYDDDYHNQMKLFCSESEVIDAGVPSWTGMTRYTLTYYPY